MKMCLSELFNFGKGEKSHTGQDIVSTEYVSELIFVFWLKLVDQNCFVCQYVVLVQNTTATPHSHFFFQILSCNIVETSF
jgi:hypothetical protein